MILSGDAAPAQFDTVIRQLNTVRDPCSVAVGVTAGLVDMGLVEHVTIKRAAAHDRWDVTVSIGLTEPTCPMGFAFTNSARDVLTELDWVGEIAVNLATELTWTPERATPDYRRALEASRASKARLLATLQPTNATPMDGLGALRRVSGQTAAADPDRGR